MKAYAIKDKDNYILVYTISISKLSARSKAIVFWSKMSWEMMYNRGYRCVPILITEVKGDK